MFSTQRAAIVVPSAPGRNLLEFFEAWGHFKTSRPAGVFVIQDCPTATWPGAFSWGDMHDEFGDDAWIFSRKDSAIRSFGFHHAWQARQELNIGLIVTLDDDCLPRNGDHLDIIGGHVEAMLMPKFASTIAPLPVRGLPYELSPPLCSHVNVGLWRGTPDFDAVTTLSWVRDGKESMFDGNVVHRVIPPGQFIPMCGMNLAFRVELTPLMYFSLMGQSQPYARFDDIWCGLIAKRICDHLGLLWTCGPPVVHHSRASDPYVNLSRESAGVGENEHFWRYVADMPLNGSSPVECMIEAGDYVAAYKPTYAIAGDYFERYSRAIRTWASLFAD